jgi:hypothetical protein
MENLIGKYYELFIDKSVIVRFKIKHVRELVIPSIKYDDGSISPQRKSIMVSEKGSGWYTIYGGLTDRISAEGKKN